MHSRISSSSILFWPVLPYALDVLVRRPQLQAILQKEIADSNYGFSLSSFGAAYRSCRIAMPEQCMSVGDPLLTRLGAVGHIRLVGKIIILTLDCER